MADTATRPRSGSDQGGRAPGSTGFEIHPDVIDGDRIIRKTATGSDRKLLRREASVLTQIASPHVVDLVELVESESSTEMITVDAGSRTLAEPSKLGSTELLRALRNCVDAVRDLHENGWEHGTIRPEHVIVGARGRIRMCSLSSARRLSTSAGSEDEDPGTRMRTDAADLIDLVEEVGRMEVTDGPWRERRERTRQNRTIVDASTRAHDALRTTGSPIEALNHLHELLGDPLHATRNGPRHASVGRGPVTRTTRSPLTGSRGEQLVSAVLIVVAASVGILLLSSATSTRASGALGHEEEVMDGSAPEPRPGGLSPDAVSGSTETAGPTGPVEEMDTNGMIPSPSSGGDIIVVGGVSYTVGEQGDVSMVADWFCDGDQRVVLLRPSTGELFIFDEWADPGSPTTGRAIGVLPDADELLPVVEECGVVLVATTDNGTVEVAVEKPSTTTPQHGGAQK